MKVKSYTWFIEVFLAFDRLFNASCGGSSLSTISARCGYYAGKGHTFWEGCERVIDWAFLPIDGPNHCAMAYAWEMSIIDGKSFERGSGLARIVLALIVILCCLVIGLIARLVTINK